MTKQWKIAVIFMVGLFITLSSFTSNASTTMDDDGACDDDEVDCPDGIADETCEGEASFTDKNKGLATKWALEECTSELNTCRSAYVLSCVNACKPVCTASISSSNANSCKVTCDPIPDGPIGDDGKPTKVWWMCDAAGSKTYGCDCDPPKKDKEVE